MTVMARVLAFAALTVGLTPYAAKAGFEDGNKLYLQCKAGAAVCTGYIVGVYDATEDSPPGRLICVPDGVTVAQLEDIVLRSLAEHPETRHLPAYLLVRLALFEIFPCRRG